MPPAPMTRVRPERGFASDRRALLIEIAIAIEIAIGSIGESFDKDPDPDPDPDFDLEGSIVLHCKT